MKRAIFLLCFCLFFAYSEQNHDFTLIKKESGKGNTLLILGGIQGDEPGGYLAANLVATRYVIKKGNVWVVPNQNLRAMLKDVRGEFGDMNRKFKQISKDDPDYKNIQKIKELITDNRVTLIVHLHDGSGFYREKYVDDLRNPKRWGQSCIIDQESIDAKPFGDLKAIATKVAKNINERLLDKDHEYRVKNTNTKNGDKEMEKALTYFAITHNKPAFANEASKELDINKRIYYHLLAIENYMKIAGIEFERGFELTLSDINRAVNSDLELSLYGGKIVLDASNLRKHVSYLPMDKKRGLEFESKNPILLLVKKGDRYVVHYGSRELSNIYPEFFEFGNSLKNIKLIVDGKNIDAFFGKKIGVKNSFMVESLPNYRVNVIGYSSKKSEDGIEIRKKDLQERFSLDKDGNIFRIEVYDKQNRFQGMVLVDFKESTPLINQNSIAQAEDNDRSS